MSLTLPKVLNAEQNYHQLVKEILPLLLPNTCLVGVQSKGVLLAKRMHQELALSNTLGSISSSMHRDDYKIRGMSKAQTTDLPFEVNGADILLIDDVLYTGRTVRAIINEIFDFGRPARIRLAVLVDRNEKQLPISADVCAVRLGENDRLTGLLTLIQNASGQFDFEYVSSTTKKPEAIQV
jgi:pyrimidine operon attenuation protein / uracil phosphoribosyltransferase